MTNNRNREFDVVIFGASGFIGQYVIEELAHSSASTEIKWAIAGRNMNKLRESLKIVQEYLGKEINVMKTPLIEADVNNALSLSNMCKKTKLILNCVGPYNLYGEAVVKACIENETHHIDLSAETKHLEEIQIQYFDAARKRKIYIVEACGFGFLIDDYGMSALKKNFPGDLNSVEYFGTYKTGADGLNLHIGTFLSCVLPIWENLFYKKSQEALKGRLFPKHLPISEYPLTWRQPPIFYSSEEKRWCLWILGLNARCIKRSQLFRCNYLNDRPILSHGYFSMPKFFKALLLGLLLGVMATFSFGRNLLTKYPSFFSGGVFSRTGPTRKQLMEGSTEFTFYGEGWKETLSDRAEQHTTKPDTKMKLTLRGPEPAYFMTAICMVQAGLTLLQEQDRMPLEGGVLTPGVAFENTSLQQRLEKRGVSFEYETLTKN